MARLNADPQKPPHRARSGDSFSLIVGKGAKTVPPRAGSGAGGSVVHFDVSRSYAFSDANRPVAVVSHLTSLEFSTITSLWLGTPHAHICCLQQSSCGKSEPQEKTAYRVLALRLSPTSRRQRQIAKGHRPCRPNPHSTTGCQWLPCPCRLFLPTGRRIGLVCVRSSRHQHVAMAMVGLASVRVPVEGLSCQGIQSRQSEEAT